MGVAVLSTYEPFSREPEYVDVNRKFVDSLPLSSTGRVLDLACGTGTITAMILEARSGATTPVVGLDSCRESLSIAREFLIERGFTPACADWVEASADCLPLEPGVFDAVVMGNAIQMLADKHRLIAEVQRVLRGGAFFAFNTSFYSGTYLRETERFYVRWVQEAFEYLRKKDEDLRRHGQAGFTRKKSLANPAFSNPWLSGGEYEALLSSFGLRVCSVRERTVMLNRKCFEAIGSYWGLASVLLRGYPVDLACEALVKSAGPAMEAEKWEAVPRHWIEIIAMKQ